MRARAVLVAALLLVACSRPRTPSPLFSSSVPSLPPASVPAESVPTTSSPTASVPAAPSGPVGTSVVPAPGMLAGRVDVGGYALAYRCAGKGRPTVLLEAAASRSGIDTYGPAIQPALASTSRVCTYDRAGDGTSDARPADVTPVTAGTQARELHTLLDAIQVKGPFVVVGNAYGGMVTRAFAAAYPKDVVGMVLLDAASEPEVAAHDRQGAGPWVDGSVRPAPNQTIDIHATARQLRAAPSLGSMPLIVVTAGILEDPFLATEPVVEARAQTRLAKLSTDSIHLLDRSKGHLLPDADPTIVIVAVRAVVDAARSGTTLPTCEQVFADVHTAKCLERGQLGVQQIKPAT